MDTLTRTPLAGGSPLVDAIADETLRAFHERGTYRRMHLLTSAQSRQMRVDGRSVIHFASSNYLDLAHHPDVVEAATIAARTHGCAAGGSRLICGNSDLHEELEAEFAKFLGVEAALLFSTGYMANLGVLCTLIRPGDIVLSDALNHASIVDACRLARADKRVFPHGDVDVLVDLLRVASDVAVREKRRVVLALDGVYSMDGDLAPLLAMTHLARQYGAIVLLDDAHGCGTLGPRGRGAAELVGAEDGVDVYVGTLGKAFGSFGAFVAGSSRLRDLLVNSARTFLFTCALSPPQVAAARAALRIVQAEPLRRERLQANATRLRASLSSFGISTAPSTTHIVPVIVGENEATMRLSARLLDRGYFAHGIRHPSVPNGTSRLRITLMATHEADEIDALARAVADELPCVLERTS
ncbi:MAG: 8-amino-7-oxononanoate synthase [Myxococcota bacterium]|nr:8-amino-7-oxononanoate synthase [Myxococcota bacterium]